MNQKEIEYLKSNLSQLIRHGCKIKSTAFGVDGRIVGVGYKPLWTNPADSKIEKIEFDFIDKHGRIIPFYLFNVVGYDSVSIDGDRMEKSDSISLDFHVYSPNKSRDKEPYDKVQIEFIKEPEKSDEHK